MPYMQLSKPNLHDGIRLGSIRLGRRISVDPQQNLLSGMEWRIIHEMLVDLGQVLFRAIYASDVHQHNQSLHRLQHLPLDDGWQLTPMLM